MTAMPVHARQKLGKQLRRLRAEVGYTLDEVAGACGWSSAKVSRFERGQVSLALHDLARLCELYELTDDEAEELQSLAADAGDSRWWLEYTDALSSRLEEYITAEATASAITVANANVIPGLLQTREYARLVSEAGTLGWSSEHIDTQVEVRMFRQRILADASVQLSFILGASVLFADAGDPQLLCRQIAHLVQCADLPNVEILVIPHSSPQTFFLGAITLFNFTNARDSSVVAVEYQGGMEFKGSPRDLRKYRGTLQFLREGALSPVESRAFLTKRMEEL